jgi:anti-sigma regulatory factor (Ser/Thr protein kinase)
MRDLSMHIIDIVQNSVRAGASFVKINIEVKEPGNVLVLEISDNGCGMDSEMVKSVVDPFVTSRTKRKVGLGLPFLKMNAENTGGNISIESEPGKGTVVTALFYLSHIDCIPFGDVSGSVALTISGNPNVDFVFGFRGSNGDFLLDSREIKKELDGISIGHPKVVTFLKEMIEGGIGELDG